LIWLALSDLKQHSLTLFLLSDSENRLLIAHGLIDENVHFKNTETLAAELIRHNKPHQIQVYPTERHGLRDARVNEHFETLMFYWLKNYL